MTLKLIPFISTSNQEILLTQILQVLKSSNFVNREPVTNAARFWGVYRREADEHDGVTKYQMVNTAPDYVTFGHGKHAWYVVICHQPHSTDKFGSYSPGRFFAAAELKTMLCHLLLAVPRAPVTPPNLQSSFIK